MPKRATHRLTNPQGPESPNKRLRYSLMTLTLIMAADPDTPLAQLCRGFDFYELALAFEDGGIKLAWDQVLALETCGQVQELFSVSA